MESTEINLNRNNENNIQNQQTNNKEKNIDIMKR